MTQKVLIVSRHPSTVEYVKEFLEKKKIPYDVKEHISKLEELNYPLIIGNIPLELFIRSRALAYIQVNLTIPKELRGKELTRDELEKYIKFITIVKEREYPNGVRTYMMLFENFNEAFNYAKSYSLII